MTGKIGERVSIRKSLYYIGIDNAMGRKASFIRFVLFRNVFLP
jgi:hypothetical protein